MKRLRWLKRTAKKRRHSRRQQLARAKSTTRPTASSHARAAARMEGVSKRGSISRPTAATVAAVAAAAVAAAAACICASALDYNDSGSSRRALAPPKMEARRLHWRSRRALLPQLRLIDADRNRRRRRRRHRCHRCRRDCAESTVAVATAAATAATAATATHRVNKSPPPRSIEPQRRRTDRRAISGGAPHVWRRSRDCAHFASLTCRSVHTRRRAARTHFRNARLMQHTSGSARAQLVCWRASSGANAGCKRRKRLSHIRA